MSTFDKFLEPISPDNPCGEDIDAAGSLWELDNLLKGQPATDATEAQDPDWSKVKELALDLLRRSRHLKVVVVLCLVELKLDGLAGFHGGLALLKGLLERYWDALYPRLDPADPDPTLRVNLVRNLSAPVHTETPFRFVKWLREIPLVDSRRAGRYCLKDLQLAKDQSETGTAPDSKAPTEAQITAAFRDIKPEVLRQTVETVASLVGLTEAVDTLMAEKVGEGNWISLKELGETLGSMNECLTPYATPSTIEGTATQVMTESGRGPVPPGPSSSRPTVVGPIASRDDVARALDNICEYYRQCEPGSPVPILLRRARRLIGMDFVASLKELAPASLAAFESILGEAAQPKSEESGVEPGQEAKQDGS